MPIKLRSLSEPVDKPSWAPEWKPGDCDDLVWWDHMPQELKDNGALSTFVVTDELRYRSYVGSLLRNS